MVYEHAATLAAYRTLARLRLVDLIPLIWGKTMLCQVVGSDSVWIGPLVGVLGVPLLSARDGTFSAVVLQSVLLGAVLVER